MKEVKVILQGLDIPKGLIYTTTSNNTSRDTLLMKMCLCILMSKHCTIDAS